MDNDPITGVSFLRRPRNLVVAVFFYVTLVMFKTCLVSMIKINAATVMDLSFHLRAAELLYQTRILLGLKDY